MTTHPTPEAADLAATTTAWADQWWDPDVGLIWMPPDRPVSATDAGPEPRSGVHLLPQTAWYAVGLLLRNGEGDEYRAVQAIAAVLDHQYDAPGQVWHGTYTLVHEAPEPEPGARIWLDYDPNWRQFISCTLLLALRHLPEAIPPPLVERIHRALRLAVEGEPDDRIADNYSNIALMHSYVCAEVGHLLDEPSWIAGGEDRARRVIDLYRAFGSFDEYNSPTYYGIDLLALGLWRGHSSSELLTGLGTEIEASFWIDSVQFFHADLANIAGPYTRSYGMDMRAYVAAYALWVWAALGRDQTPIPNLDEPLDHGMDVMLGPVVALIGAAVPEKARSHLVAFQGERSITRRLSDETAGDRVVAAWLGPTAMLGAESSTVDLSWWDQFYGATAHWRRADGSLGWLRAIVPGRPDTTVEPGRLTIRWHHGNVNVDQDEDAPKARFLLDRPADSPAAIDGLHLHTDGLTLEAAGRELHALPGPGETTTFVIEVS